MIEVRLDNRLTVRKRDLPPGHEAAIKQRLTVANGEKAAAAKRRQWGWQEMPDSFALYEDRGPELVLPRGYAGELRAGLRASGYDVRWVDQTSKPSLRIHDLVACGPHLQPDQERACQALLQHRQGVVQAPTGSGKTVLVLEAWRRTGLRGLILVEKAQLVGQWRERAREHLGVEAGMIGEGEWDERDLTIAMFQTLRRREIGASWWRRWGFTACDEAHHVRADTYQGIVQQVCSQYLIGVTATPLEGMWEQPYLTHVLGPIFHVTTDEEMRRSGRRVTPKVVRVRTGWRWRPENRAQANLVDTKTIYRYVTKQLEGDLSRVGMIALNVIDQPASCAQLVLADRLAYLDRIESALDFGGYQGDVLMMRGSESARSREYVTKRAAEGNCVILSTVADEGTDIPRLDRLHLVWPSRQELKLKQKVGRVLRAHPDKNETIVFDYVDEEGVLASQARTRMGYYRRAGYPIEEMSVQRSFTS